MNEQRKVIYKIRRDILNDEANNELVTDFIEEVAFNLAEQFRPEKKNPSVRDYNWDDINNQLRPFFNTDSTFGPEEASSKHMGDMAAYFKEAGTQAIIRKFEGLDPEQVKLTYREVLLATFDQFWKDHLLAMDHLKEGINLRSHGGKDPLVEYKREAYTIYEGMKFAIKRSIVERMSHIRLMTQAEIDAIHQEQEAALQAQLKAHQEAQAAQQMTEEKKVIRATLKVGRNDPCPCGSGKKFKSCHGA
jgi:preprotein translocase subunit SecA